MYTRFYIFIMLIIILFVIQISLKNQFKVYLDDQYNINTLKKIQNCDVDNVW